MVKYMQSLFFIVSPLLARAIVSALYYNRYIIWNTFMSAEYAEVSDYHYAGIDQ